MARIVLARQIEVVDDAIADILRYRTPEERVAMAMAAGRTARMLIAGGLQEQHPDWADRQVQTEVNRRLLNGAA